MAEIRVLDKHTAELIAAGEVVERPASVAKELLENAIDAGATQITLSAVRGGIQQLQIVDNGSGIEAEYIDKAFIRHATSKIATAEDLGHIHTLGFRGEALASIASVARVEVLTRTEADEYACCYRIEGGEERGMEPGARPVGTTITVSDLFYNTPARMKFLKKDASEGTFVAETVLHAALSHPEISFRYLRDGKQQYVTPGDGDLRSAVYAVLGREFARDLLAVDGGSELYHVTGLVTPPRACRASRGAQHFFVNGRYVKNRTMMAALENAYKGTMMQGKFPGAVLMLELPPDMVDVNVHPAKTEIRFAKESDVFDAVYRAVRAALATPGSGECRFEMGHTASEAEQTTMQPTAPAAPAAQHRPAPDKNRFTTLSAAEYRALAGLAAGDIPNEMIPFAARHAMVAIDVQTMLRWVENGGMVYHDWAEKKELLPYVRFLKTDAAEAEILTGLTDRAEAARQLYQWGAKEILITHNTEVLVYDGREIYTCPIRARNLSGRTGRGDTTFAGYINERLTADIPTALRFATALVSLKMETPGPFTGTRADVDAYLKEFY